MNGKDYEFLIVGSGAGGATLARELSRKGRQVLVVERGKLETKVGTVRDSMKYFDLVNLGFVFRKSQEGVNLIRAFMAGGSTLVSCGNGVRCLESELAELGMDLHQEFQEVEEELDIHPINERLLSDGSLEIRHASDLLGYKMDLMPKFIDADKCRKDGVCTMGCATGARWSALAYLQEALTMGTEVLYDTLIDRVEVEHGKVRGVVGRGPQGPVSINAKTVILAAGGLGTPVILQSSGINEAGSGLFIDIYRNTFGITKNFNQIHEPTMALVDMEFYADEGFILSPYVIVPRETRLTLMGYKGFMLPTNRMIGIMTKIRDESTGQVCPDGSVSKRITRKDQQKLDKGAQIASEILIKAGADPKSIVNDAPGGAHPGGTAAIGGIVDSALQTKVDGLFVCDGSVLPVAPGLPPIMTIVALAKRLGKTLAV